MELHTLLIIIGISIVLLWRPWDRRPPESGLVRHSELTSSRNSQPETKPEPGTKPADERASFKKTSALAAAAMGELSYSQLLMIIDRASHLDINPDELVVFEQALKIAHPPRVVGCDRCDGTGHAPIGSRHVMRGEKCPFCDGTGVEGAGRAGGSAHNCSRCYGDGDIYDPEIDAYRSCPSCCGTGY